jgi:hypothetical protein
MPPPPPTPSAPVVAEPHLTDEDLAAVAATGQPSRDCFPGTGGHCL